MGNKPTILITGGHMTPALAVMSELDKQAEYNYIWIGHKYNQFGNKNTSPEYNIINGKGIKFVDLKAGKLTRNWGGDNWLAGLQNLLKVPWGFIQSLFIVVRYRPKLVMSFGGYLALPVVAIGRLLGVKVVTHEQTAVTGLTNRIIPKFAHKVLISWPSSAKYYPASKTVLTGNPIRSEVFEAASETLELDKTLPTIYVTGGNQGSHKVNLAVFDALDDILQIANVIHQTGDSSVTGDAGRAQQMLQALPVELQNRYVHQPFFYADQIGEVYSKADLVIARSGANTVYEILALGKPAIFIPIPWVTHNEQHLNAEIAQATGIAGILTEENLSGASLMLDIEQAIQQIQNGQGLSGKSLEQSARAAKEQVKLNAAELIVKEITPYL